MIKRGELDYERAVYRIYPRVYNVRHKIIRGVSSSLSNTLFDCGGQITIGRNVSFGHDCMVLTGAHDYTTTGKTRKNTVFYESVVIKDGASIYSGVIILPGVVIGKNSVIGAGSVVTKSVPAGELWAGNPAKFIKKIEFKV